MSDTNTQRPGIKVISPSIHGVMDYLIIAIFLIAPSVFDLTGVFAFGAYGLAAAHFLLAVTTSFAGGLFRVLSLRTHGLLELLVSLGMIVSPWVFGFADAVAPRNFFLFFGIFIFAVWLLTDYGFWAVKSENNETEDDLDLADQNSKFSSDNSKHND